MGAARPLVLQSASARRRRADDRLSRPVRLGSIQSTLTRNRGRIFPTSIAAVEAEGAANGPARGTQARGDSGRGRGRLQPAGRERRSRHDRAPQGAAQGTDRAADRRLPRPHGQADGRRRAGRVRERGRRRRMRGRGAAGRGRARGRRARRTGASRFASGSTSATSSSRRATSTATGSTSPRASKRSPSLERSASPAMSTTR